RPGGGPRSARDVVRDQQGLEPRVAIPQSGEGPSRGQKPRPQIVSAATVREDLLAVGNARPADVHRGRLADCIQPGRQGSRGGRWGAVIIDSVGRFEAAALFEGDPTGPCLDGGSGRGRDGSIRAFTRSRSGPTGCSPGDVGVPGGASVGPDPPAWVSGGFSE